MIIPSTSLGNFIKSRKTSVRTTDPGLDQNRPEIFAWDGSVTWYTRNVAISPAATNSSPWQ